MNEITSHRDHRYIENHLNADEKKWFAINTKYKAEKFVVRLLQKKGVTAYVPLLQKTKRYTRKVRNYEVPLINCYAFVCIDSEQYTRVLETEYVIKFVRQGKNLISIPQEEIDILNRIVNTNLDFNSERIDYSDGDIVEVIGGQLTGLKGKVVNRNNKNELLVELINMGIQLKILINSAYLRPVQNGMIYT